MIMFRDEKNLSKIACKDYGVSCCSLYIGASDIAIFVMWSAEQVVHLLHEPKNRLIDVNRTCTGERDNVPVVLFESELLQSRNCRRVG